MIVSVVHLGRTVPAGLVVSSPDIIGAKAHHGKPIAAGSMPERRVVSSPDVIGAKAQRTADAFGADGGVAMGLAAKSPFDPPFVLDGRSVPIITAYLFHVGGHDAPQRLACNESKCFVGNYVLGLGFTFDDSDGEGKANSIREMESLIERNPRNSERIFPYINGADVNEHPQHKHYRYIINFGQMSEREAGCWPDLLSLVEERVKPGRLAQNREARARYWWRFAETAPRLYQAIDGLNRVLVRSLTSTNFPTFTFLPGNMVYDQTLIVFSYQSVTIMAVLCSRGHESWAVFFGATMKDDPRYNVDDCFKTFPFPADFESNTALRGAGQAYYDFRAALMIQNNEGLTKIYNRFHDPDERSPDILKLRELHGAMDRAVLDAYGWTDLWKLPVASSEFPDGLGPPCEFLLDYEEDDENDELRTGNSQLTTRRRRKPWRYRWPDDFRDEVLARLLELNHQRAEEERLSGVASEAGKGKAAKKTTGRRKTSTKTPDQPELFET